MRPMAMRDWVLRRQLIRVLCQPLPRGPLRCKRVFMKEVYPFPRWLQRQPLIQRGKRH